MPPPLPRPKIGQDLTGPGIITSYPTPSIDTQLSALLESNVANYVAQLCGTPPPEGTDPDKLLVQEMPIDWKHVQRTYMSDRVNEDTYNASEGFSGEAVAFPIFTRDYIVRRANYVPKAKPSSLAGLVNATVTAAGVNYTQATVGVTLSGGTGSGGAITAIVSNGAIVQLVITAEGSYTIAPSLTITDTGTGSGATGTCAVQPAGAILVKEDMLRQPDQTYDGLYVLVRRVYETLPGPWLPTTRWDEDLGQVYGRRRAELSDPTTQVSDLSQFTKIVSYQSREGSSIVAWRIEETYSDGTGTGVGNEVYPIKTSEKYDDDRGNVQETRQLVIAAGQTSSDVLSGTTARKKWYEPYPPSKFFLFEVIETFETPCPQRAGLLMHPDAQMAVCEQVHQILAIDAPDLTPDFYYLEYNDLALDNATKLRKLVIVPASPGFPALVEVDYDMTRNGSKITRTYTVVPVATASGGVGFGSGYSYKYEFRRIDKYRKLQIFTQWDTPASYYERRTGAYAFPALLADGDYVWSDVCGAFSHIQTRREILTQFITLHEWFTSLQGLQSYFVLRPVTHLLGRGWQIDEGTINNSDTYTYEGSCTATYNFTASSPTLDTYNTLIDGTPQLVAEENTKDENLYYRRISHYLVMQ